MVASKDSLHRLIDELSERDLNTAQAFLEFLQFRAEAEDPMLRLLRTAPEDDERSTPHEDESAREAWQQYKRGHSVSNEDLRREIGW